MTLSIFGHFPDITNRSDSQEDSFKEGGSGMMPDIGATVEGENFNFESF